MCDEALNTYSAYLEDHGLMPWPVFWTEANCGGQRLPLDGVSLYGEPAYEWGQAYDAKGNAKTLFCPEQTNFSMLVSSPETAPTEYHKLDITGLPSPEFDAQAANVELLIKDTTDIVVFHSEALGRFTMDRMTSITPVYQGQTVDTFKRSMCNGGTIGIGNSQGAFYPESPACDAYMTTYCADNASKDLNECNCFKDQKLLKEALPDVVLPVRCMGANCAFSGYLTKEMASAGCDVTICEEIVELHGDDIADSSSANIFCGYRYYNVHSSPTPSATPTSSGDFPVYAWILISVGIVLIAVIAGFFARKNK